MPHASSSHALSENGTAARIVAAARRHFFAHGFRGVTMDDLAAELGMSKKTLYAAFPSKNDLLQAVVADKLAGAEADFERLSAHHPADLLSRLHELLACVQQHADEIKPSFVRDVRREAPEIFELVQSRRRALIQRHFGKLFDEGRKAGIFRKDISSRMMIEVLLSAVEAIVNPGKLADLGLSPKAAFVTIIKVVLEGALTPEAKTR